MLRLSVFAGSILLLAGCATTPATTQVADVGPPPEQISAYGMFLAGEAALNDGRSAEAAQWFEGARRGSRTEAVVDERAFTAALLAGDVTRAAALAPTSADAAEAVKRMGRLVVAVEHIAQGKGKAAHAILTSNEIAFPHQSAAALLAPWAAAMAGDGEGAVVRPQVKGDEVVNYFGLLGQAALYERAGRYDEAETDYKAISGSDGAGEAVTLAYGGYLERRGRRLDAVALYDAALARDPDNIDVQAAKARAAAGKSAPPQMTLKQGAAQAMLASAATMLAAKQNQLAMAYLRLAVRLDPQRDDAWVMMGDLMQAAGDMTSARLAYERPKAGSADYFAAQAKLAWSYQGADDPETALKVARAAAATGDVESRVMLADLLRVNKLFGEAVEVLNGVIAQTKTPDWHLYYSRGVSLEQMGRWPEAQADLRKALAEQPNEPELLNYLGYSLIDRGENLREALSMVERAVAANPRSGAMVDSLGWAHYRLGDYKLAVQKLEEAAELEAGDPEINDHLGDAYWRVGRRDEALFQWQRVLTLQPDEKIKARAEAKIASGLDAPAAKVAGK